MPILRAADRLAVPWRNGAGVTMEIAAGDDWRISVATLDRDAPFSRFDGYDRTLVLIDGAVTLAGEGWDRRLRRGDSVAFPGEASVAATVHAPAHALNVMSQRTDMAHEVHAVAAPLRVEEHDFAIAWDGDLRFEGQRLLPLDAVAGPARITGSGRLLAIRFVLQKR